MRSGIADGERTMQDQAKITRQEKTSPMSHSISRCGFSIEIKEIQFLSQSTCIWKSSNRFWPSDSPKIRHGIWNKIDEDNLLVKEIFINFYPAGT